MLSLHPKQYVVPISFPAFIGFIFDCVLFMFYNVGSTFLTKYIMCFNGLDGLKLQSECFSIFVCLSFSLFRFPSVCPFYSISTENVCLKNTSQLLLFYFLRLCTAALFFLHKMLLIAVLLLSLII